MLQWVWLLTAFSNFLLLLATEWGHDGKILGSSWLVLRCFPCSPLKMWPNLLARKYTYSKSDIWLNVLSPFLPQFGAFDRHPQASSEQSAFSQWGSSQDFRKAIRKTSVLAWFSPSFTTFDVFLVSLSRWNTPLHPRPNLLVDYSIYFTHSVIVPPCLTVGMVSLGWDASPSLFQTYCCSLCSNNSIFVFNLTTEVSSRRFFPLSTWSVTNFSQGL